MKVMVFDVGGTEIKYSVMDEQMNRFDAGSVPTPQDTQEHFLDTIYALYASHKDEVDGIAMALPGFVDANTGYVSNGGALLYNTGTQVGQLVRERCGCRVTLENDGKAAAIAELRAGALQGCCNAAVFIIGTGVGGGIIANGQLVRGVHFTAGEYSFVNTNADEWENTEKTMACQCMLVFRSTARRCCVVPCCMIIFSTIGTTPTRVIGCTDFGIRFLPWRVRRKILN